jgi:hypothetical protein
MSTSRPDPSPSPFNYVLSFLIVGLCWGFTTPFIRKAAMTFQTPTSPSITDPNKPWLWRQMAKILFNIVGLLRSPRYAIPLVLNLSGSVWFFLLVGKAGKFDTPHLFDLEVQAVELAVQNCLSPCQSQTHSPFSSPSLGNGMSMGSSLRSTPGSGWASSVQALQCVSLLRLKFGTSVDVFIISLGCCGGHTFLGLIFIQCYSRIDGLV